MSDQDVLVEELDGVATVTLNRPSKLNAMTADGFTLIVAVLERLAADDTVRAVLLTGAGRGFCAGGDVGDMTEEQERSADEEAAFLRGLMRTTELLRTMPKTTIAAVNGPCAGAGFSIACAADLRYASETAVFKTAFLSVGLSGDFGGSWTLPRLVGEAAARELYLLSENVTAADAYRLGLVAKVLPADELLDHARGVAHRCADAAPLAVAAIKANLADNATAPLAEALTTEARRHVDCGRTADAAEAATAFVERRQPVFRGR